MLLPVYTRQFFAGWRVYVAIAKSPPDRLVIGSFEKKTIFEFFSP
jgi:hypothetical protein